MFILDELDRSLKDLDKMEADTLADINKMNQMLAKIHALKLEISNLKQQLKKMQSLIERR